MEAIGSSPPIIRNRISAVMVNMLASSEVAHGFEPRLGQTKDYKIGICCFSAKHAALMKKSKDWLVLNANSAIFNSIMARTS
jgi:hypothetical protein